jgi:hypothetical protein
MMKTSFLLAVLSLLLIGGCGDGGAQVLKRRSNLERLGAAYLEYHQLNQRSPANAQELDPFLSLADGPRDARAKASGEADDDHDEGDAALALREGDIQMIWSADLVKPGPAMDAKSLADLVLGFEAGVPAHGGYVVMADGSVRLLKRNEFQAASMISSVED